MPYDPNDRSELEKRFEGLFEQTFHCPIDTVLIPQHKVEVNGRLYRIDYALVTDKTKIAIELDGHGKIQGAADSTQAFQDFLSRQNDIVQAGFTLYRFTWRDVVHRGGWVARKQLQKILKGQAFTRSSNSALPSSLGYSFTCKPATENTAKSTTVQEIPLSLESAVTPIVMKKLPLSQEEYNALTIFFGFLALCVLFIILFGQNSTQPDVEPIDPSTAPPAQVPYTGYSFNGVDSLFPKEES